MCSAVSATAQLSSGSKRQLEELQPSTIFRIRATCPNDAQCITLASRRMQKYWRPFIQRVGYTSSPQSPHPLAAPSNGVCAMAERESSYILEFACSFRIGEPRAPGYSNGIKLDIDMQTKENAAALAVFFFRTVTRRACGVRLTNGGVFAPPFTLPTG